VVKKIIPPKLIEPTEIAALETHLTALVLSNRVTSIWVVVFRLWIFSFRWRFDLSDFDAFTTRFQNL